MNPSTALAQVVAAALPVLGVRHVVLCPGSRSAPLAYALAAAPDVSVHVRLDERTAGFVALGLGKAGAPAAVVTTSGTAVAELHPAVLEASHAGVPLLVISADRPHELRGTGANQTMDQVKLFGTAVRWFGEIPAPAVVPSPSAAAGWRNVVSRAVAAATGALSGDPGPVQLNLGFAEPLVPDGAPGSGGESGSGGASRSGGAGRAAASAPTAADRAGLTVVPPAAPTPVHLDLDPAVPTVVLAGDGAGPAAVSTARAAGWPLLAEPSSDARVPGSVSAYRLLLNSELGRRIERVVMYGRPTLSRPVTQLLTREDVDLVVVAPRPVWTDPARRARAVVPALAVEPADPGPWAAEWAAAHQLSSEAIDRVLDDGPLAGPSVARVVDAATASADALVVGSSNSIRDLDLVAAGSSSPVFANRGLAGIDGTVSTALGVALARSRGVTRCLLGDLTFLHDAGALSRGSHETTPQVQYVVVDDAGGGIFGMLEQAGVADRGDTERAEFERFFATPQQVDLESLCRAYGVAYSEPNDLEPALAQPDPGLAVLHVRIDRAGQRDLNARLAKAVRAVVP